MMDRYENVAQHVMAGRFQNKIFLLMKHLQRIFIITYVSPSRKVIKISIQKGDER